MRKFIRPKLSSMFKNLGKPKPQPSSSSPSLVQQESSGTPTPNPTPSLAIHPPADGSATEGAPPTERNPATSVATSTTNTIASRSETAPTSRSVAKDTAVNALK